jgi:hypothetical protein
VKVSFCTTDFVASTKPWDYMVSSGLCNPDSTLPEEELIALHAVLSSLDEEHLGFALVIAENFAPERFAVDAAKLLGHHSLSVRVNAYRVIRAVPAQSLTDSLKEAVAKGLSECPQQEAFADVLIRN